MPNLSPGWATDLAILEHAGSTVEDRGDHLVVRTPRNPTFHWGNCLMVTDPDPGTANEAQRWVATFQQEFPEATWVALGLRQMPADVDAWSALDVELGLDDVLTTRTLPRQTALADGYGYVARRLREDDDWEQLTGRALAENLASGEYEPAAHETFVRARTAIQRELSDRGVATFVGAFTPEGVLVADLGIVVCGRRARYQNVGTDEAHRRRGLASHLLGIAARWAAEQGCDEWVIVTESTNPAGRVYRSVGFAPDVPSVQAYRPPSARFGRV